MCGFNSSVNCECSRRIKYIYIIKTLRDVLMTGIADLGKQGVLSLTDIFLQTYSIINFMTFVKIRDMTRV